MLHKRFLLLMLVVFVSLATIAVADDKEDEGKLLTVREIAKGAFVEVQYRFHDPMKVVEPVLLTTPLVTRWSSYFREDLPYYDTGVLIEPNKVLTQRIWVLPEMIKSVKVKFMDGTEVNAKIEEYLVNSPAAILYLETPRAKGALTFVAHKPALDAQYFSASVDKIRDFYQISVGTTKFDTETTGQTVEEQYRGDLLLFDKDLKPVSYLVYGLKVTAPDFNNWVTADVLAGPRRTIAQQRDYDDKLRNLLNKDLLAVRFTLRNLRAGGEDPVSFGVCLDGNGTILVPSTLSADAIKNIKKITVQVNGSEVEAKFVGQLNQYSAVVIRVPELKGPSAVIDTTGALARFKMYGILVPFSVARRSFAVPFPAFSYGYTKCYDEKYYLDLGTSHDNDRYYYYDRGDSMVPPGSFVFSPDGKCVAMMLTYSKEFLQASDQQSYYWYDDDESPARGVLRPVPFSEIIPKACAPTDHVVANLFPMSIIESRKIVWLGVEMQLMNKNLAEYLDVLEKTKYGQVGGRVTWVYKGSPAERKGIKIGDILMSVQKKGSTTKLELNDDMVAGYSWGRSGPWPNRRYPLITELSKLGVGTEVVMTFLRDKEEKQVEFPLEEAPADFVAAKYYKCWELGFRVKDLTYEVRRYFNLTEAQKGVIVYGIESGSKADIADMGIYVLIVKVNGVEVNDVDNAKELLLKAIDEDPAETVSLEVLWYGETSFVEVRKPSKEEIEKIREEHRFDTDEEEEGGEEGVIEEEEIE